MMSKGLIVLLGLAFAVIGLVGFFSPGFMGTHLSIAHNLIHLVSGAAALSFGLWASVRSAKFFALTFGIIYLFLGIAGITAPPGIESMGMYGYDEHLLVVIPGDLELGTNDALLHMAVGAMFLLAFVLPQQVISRFEIKQEMPAEKTTPTFKA